MTAGFVIRRFEPADQDAARSLVLDGMVEHWGGLDPTLNRDLDDIEATYADALFLVGCLGGQVAATAALHPGTPAAGDGLVTRMAVASDRRRLGLGRQLLERLASEARELGLRRLVLETTTDWGGVIAFYRSCGFTVTHEESGRWSSNTWFARDL